MPGRSMPFMLLWGSRRVSTELPAMLWMEALEESVSSSATAVVDKAEGARYLADVADDELEALLFMYMLPALPLR